MSNHKIQLPSLNNSLNKSVKTPPKKMHHTPTAAATKNNANSIPNTYNLPNISYLQSSAYSIPPNLNLSSAQNVVLNSIPSSYITTTGNYSTSTQIEYNQQQVQQLTRKKNSRSKWSTKDDLKLFDLILNNYLMNEDDDRSLMLFIDKIIKNFSFLNDSVYEDKLFLKFKIKILLKIFKNELKRGNVSNQIFESSSKR